MHVCAMPGAIRQPLREPGLSYQQRQPRKCTAWAHRALRDRERLGSRFTQVTHVLQPSLGFLGSHRLTHTKVKENKATS